jgi:Domain of unknown function (DUF6431)
MFREGEGPPRIGTWQGTVRAGLHASRDSLYRTARVARQVRSGVKAFPLTLLPRRCPHCGRDTIIGHGQRRKQAHDDRHDWIWVRRGLCRPCGETFTILPTWSSPYGQYSFRCRRQSWESSCHGIGGWEQVSPQTKDPNRLPDPATLRRWACRRLLSLCCSLKFFWFCWPGWSTFFRAPTILAWDWAAAWRNLRLEAHSP